MRVGIIALLHESNTFITEPTTIEHFRQDLLLAGPAVREQLAGTHHEVAGFFEGLAEQGIEAVPIFAARALPFGPIRREAFEELMERMGGALRQAGPLDGLLVAPHGATASQFYPDADGRWLRQLRRWTGPERPIIGTLDPHANLSAAMVDATDALLAYRTNPHLDQRARGVEAATLMARCLRGEVRPTQAAARPPIAINIQCQQTDVPPCRPLYQLADSLLEQPGVLSDSVLLGFPYADVPQMGSALLVVTDKEPKRAAQLAHQLASYLWAHRAEFDPPLIGIDQALDQAMQLDGPVALLDMGDNVGGGSPADGTLLAHAICQRRVPSAFVCLYDPQSVEQAQSAGTGARLSLRLGGKTDDRHGPPLVTECEVVSLHDGRFEEPEARHGAVAKMDQGRTAVVRTPGGLTAMLTSRRMPPFSLHQLISCGVDPRAFQVLVVKGVHAPLAAYGPICKHLIRVNTPGVTTADIRSLDYQHRRRPMFPFEPQAQWP